MLELRLSNWWRRYLARKRKLEVAAVNLRIPKVANRDYIALVAELFSQKRNAKVFGNSFLAISSFKKDTGFGVFSKFNEIDLDGDWFDADEFESARTEDVDEVQIPSHLKPNLTQFYFFLDEVNHLILFEKYSASKALSPQMVEKFFRTVVQAPSIVQKFGRVEIDVVDDIGEVEKILRLPELKELKITIRKPNPIDIGDDLANIIEERLHDQHGTTYVESLAATGHDNLAPNDRTEKLALIAAENGELEAKSKVNGYLKPFRLSKSPMIQVDTISAEMDDKSAFYRLANKLIERVVDLRAKVRG